MELLKFLDLLSNGEWQQRQSVEWVQPETEEDIITGDEGEEALISTTIKRGLMCKTSECSGVEIKYYEKFYIVGAGEKVITEADGWQVTPKIYNDSGEIEVDDLEDYLLEKADFYKIDYSEVKKN